MAGQPPYHFVPLSPWIYFPEWAPMVSHDIPFKDGYCGELLVTIVNHSPLLIGGRRTTVTKEDAISPSCQRVYFLENPEGDYIIPGSTLRGLIRNTLEIAGFAKMQFVDDERFSFRDRYSKEYRTKISGKVFSGRLRFVGDEWRLYPCQHVKIKHKDMDHYLGTTLLSKPDESALSKYLNQWPIGTLLRFNLTATNSFKEKKLAVPDKCGQKRGNIVYTGPMIKGSKVKRFDYIFYDEKDSYLSIPEKVFHDFTFSHAEQEDFDDSTNKLSLLQYLKKNHAGLGIPVFFVMNEDEAKVKAIGLAKMMKLPCDYSIHELIENRQAAHLKSVNMDLPELIFGSRHQKGSGSLKTRVFFSDAVCKSNRGFYDSAPTVLVRPNGSYLPGDSQQDTENRTEFKTEFNRYMNENSRIKGWKKYPLKKYRPDKSASFTQAANNRHLAQLSLVPMLGGAEFTTKIRFHNLKPEELGAVLWCLDLGGNNSCLHSLGMGKPLGYGQVSLRLLDFSCRSNRPGGALSPDKAVEAFQAMMEQSYGDANGGSSWKSSPQLQHLLALSRPIDDTKRGFSNKGLDDVEQDQALNDIDMLRLPKVAGLGLHQEENDLENAPEEKEAESNPD